MKITLIGGGKLGKQLYSAFTAQTELKLVQWVVRSAEKTKTSEGIPLSNEIKELYPTDLYLIAVSDQAIPSVAAHSVGPEHKAGGRRIMHKHSTIPLVFDPAALDNQRTRKITQVHSHLVRVTAPS